MPAKFVIALFKYQRAFNVLIYFVSVSASFATNIYKDFANRDANDKVFNDVKMYAADFDGLELLSQVKFNYEQFYVLTNVANKKLWFSMTPCNNYIEEWVVSSSLTDDAWNKYRAEHILKYEERLRSLQSDSKQRRHNREILRESISGFLDGETDVKVTTRIYGEVVIPPNKQIIVYMRAPPGTFVLFYASYRYPTNEPFIGFPRISEIARSRLTKTCITKDEKLKISFRSVSSTEMDRVDYCVAVNPKLSLPNRCSAHLYIKPKAIPSSDRIRAMLAHSSTRRLKNAQYRCTSNATIMFPNLNLHNTSYYINIYAINRINDLSSSYPTVIWDHRKDIIERCGRNVVQLNVKHKNSDYYQLVRLSTDFYLNMGRKARTSRSHARYWYIWIHPCRLPPPNTKYKVYLRWFSNGGSRNATMDTGLANGRLVCNHSFDQNPDNVCDKNNRQLQPTGIYKLTVKTKMFLEPNVVIGQVVLSTHGVQNKIFPYLGRPEEYTIKNCEMRQKLVYNCSTRRLSVKISAYENQIYCFFLSETYNHPNNIKAYKQSQLDKVNFCFPGALNYIEEKCDMKIYEKDTFKPMSVQFDHVIHQSAGYLVYVYVRVKPKSPHHVANSHVFPFHSLGYISGSNEISRCKTRKTG